jgi:hypothetical protein
MVVAAVVAFQRDAAKLIEASIMLASLLLTTAGHAVLASYHIAIVIELHVIFPFHHFLQHLAGTLNS